MHANKEPIKSNQEILKTIKLMLIQLFMSPLGSGANFSFNLLTAVSQCHKLHFGILF